MIHRIVVEITDEEAIYTSSKIAEDIKFTLQNYGIESLHSVREIAATVISEHLTAIDWRALCLLLAVTLVQSIHTIIGWFGK